MTLREYKQRVKDYIEINPTPQSWRLYKVINNPDVKLKRLLKDMEREQLITINYVTEPSGKVLRILKNKMNIE